MSNDFDLRKQKPSVDIPKYKRKNILINWKNRFNIEYDIIEEPVKVIGKSKSFKDFIGELLNPNVNDNSKNVYGVAKKMEPVNSTINRMRSTIDNANSQLKNYYNYLNDLAQQAKQQESTTTITTTTTNGGDTNDK